MIHGALWSASLAPPAHLDSFKQPLLPVRPAFVRSVRAGGECYAARRAPRTRFPLPSGAGAPASRNAKLSPHWESAFGPLVDVRSTLRPRTETSPIGDLQNNGEGSSSSP